VPRSVNLALATADIGASATAHRMNRRRPSGHAGVRSREWQDHLPI